jgi:hypothetical protein
MVIKNPAPHSLLNPVLSYRSCPTNAYNAQEKEDVDRFFPRNLANKRYGFNRNGLLQCASKYGMGRIREFPRMPTC